MTTFFFRGRATKTARRGATAAGLLLLWLLAFTGQAPSWVLATTGSPTPLDNSQTQAVATDASGNVFVTGYFQTAVVFGSTVLTSAGGYDIFIAKYVPTTGTWAWAVRAGGTDYDEGLGIAVSGNSVYVTGYIYNSTTNANAVTFGGAAGPGGSAVQLGATGPAASRDLVLAKYTDNGSSATLSWTQVAGGTGPDEGHGLATVGTDICVTGFITNNLANGSAVVLGGTGTTPGTTPQYGAGSGPPSHDLLVAKYTDLGSSASMVWSQVAGGKGDDEGNGIVAYELSVYVTGSLANNTLNANQVTFGGAGTVAGTQPQLGASAFLTSDLVVAKYFDLGSSATVGWAQVGGGAGADVGLSVAVSGSRVYATGYIFNTNTNLYGVLFGGAGLVAGTHVQNGVSQLSDYDLVLAKYEDNGPSATLGWTQVGGGSNTDLGYSLAASGSSVYVAAYVFNNTSNVYGVLFGGTGTTPGTVALPGAGSFVSPDLLLAKYVDHGPSATLAWARVDGGEGADYGFGLALSGSRLYVAGRTMAPATFGSLAVTAPANKTVNFLGAVDLATPLAAALPAASAALHLYPNPASGPATLSGATPNITVDIFDALGRRVATTSADAQGTAALPAGLAPGLYLVRAGASTVRWVVE